MSRVISVGKSRGLGLKFKLPSLEAQASAEPAAVAAEPASQCPAGQVWDAANLRCAPVGEVESVQGEVGASAVAVRSATVLPSRFVAIQSLKQDSATQGDANIRQLETVDESYATLGTDAVADEPFQCPAGEVLDPATGNCVGAAPPAAEDTSVPQDEPVQTQEESAASLWPFSLDDVKARCNELGAGVDEAAAACFGPASYIYNSGYTEQAATDLERHLAKFKTEESAREQTHTADTGEVVDFVKAADSGGNIVYVPANAVPEGNVVIGGQGIRAAEEQPAADGGSATPMMAALGPLAVLEAWAKAHPLAAGGIAFGVAMLGLSAAFAVGKRKGTS